MRDSAVLTRPTAREPAWAEPKARDRSLQTTMLLLGGLFVVALGLGYGITRLAPGAPVQRISDTEYTAVVAQLYLRDHNTDLARQRLNVVGVPADLVQKAVADAQAGRTATPNDRAALDALSAALVTPAATVTSVQSQTPGGLTSAPTASTTEPDSSLSWIGPMVAFFLALGLGFLVLARTAGLSVSGIRLPWNTAPARSRSLAATPAPRRSGVIPNRSSETGRPSVSISEISLDVDDDESPRPVVSRATSLRRARTATATRPTVFQSQYRVGDDPFEEIHPVADPRTGGLIAACGLTATLHLDSIRHGGYYAFTAWIQDYAGGDELHAAGLVAPGATEIARSSIDSWVRSGQVDAVLSLERGATTVVGTDDVKATISVVDVSYGNDDRVSDAYVTGLTVRFEIHQSDLDDEVEG